MAVMLEFYAVIGHCCLLMVGLMRQSGQVLYVLKLLFLKVNGFELEVRNCVVYRMSTLKLIMILFLLLSLLS